MGDEMDHRDSLHDALGAIGADLPEPKAPQSLRARIASMPCTPVVPVQARGARVFRVGLWVTGAVAATLAIIAGVMVVQNERLRGELERARADVVTRPAAQASPPLMMANFDHEQCPIAGEVTPRFRRMASEHEGAPVIFVTFDMSTGCSSQAKQLAHELDVDCVFECKENPVETGTVMLVDRRSHQVLASCRGADELDEIEQALTTAVLTCEPPGR